MKLLKNIICKIKCFFKSCCDDKKCGCKCHG